MMKSKGYSKGGSKMMKARGGKMAKGYSKGGAKMIKAKDGIGVRGQKSNASRYNVGKFDKTGKKAGNTTGRFTGNDIRVINKLMQSGLISKSVFAKVTKKDPMTKAKPIAKSRLTASGKRMLAAKNRNKNN